jgi:hypothetical protein
MDGGIFDTTRQMIALGLLVHGGQSPPETTKHGTGAWWRLGCNQRAAACSAATAGGSGRRQTGLSSFKKHPDPLYIKKKI